MQDTTLGVGFADGFVGLDQDVTGLDLFNHMRLTAGALVQQLEDMQARGRAQDGGDTAGLELIQLAHKLRRQLAGRAPAQFTAAHGVARVRITGRQLGKVAASAHFLQRFFGTAGAAFQHLRGGLLGQRHQNVRQVVFAAVGVHRAFHEQIRLGVGDHDFIVHFAFAQAVQHHFAAHLFAELVQVGAFALEALTESLRAELVAFGNAGQCALQLGVVQAQPGLLGVLQLHRFGHHLLKHLRAQHLGRRQRHILLFQHGLGFGHALAQADFGDHVLVDNRHNAVGLAHGSAGLGEGGGKQGGNQQFFHQSFPGTSLILL